MREIFETRGARIRRAAAGLAAALALLGLRAAPALAAADTFAVHITPFVDYGIVVDTSAAAWTASANLDTTMAGGFENVMSTGIKVTIVGNFNGQELEVQGAALDTWTLDVDEIDRQDQLRLYALFTKDAPTAPASALFSGVVNLVNVGGKIAGQPEADEATDNNHVMELPVAHPLYADVDKMPVGAVRRLWLRADAPSSTSTDRVQRFTVTLTAVNGKGL